MRVVCLAVCLGSCGWARAHAAFDDGVSIWSGALHVLTSPLSIAAIVGLALVGAGVRDPWTPVAGGLAGCAAGLAAWCAPWAPIWLAPALVALIGLVAVSGARTGPLAVAALSICAGMAAGLGAELEQPGVQTISSAAAATCVALVLALVWTDELAKVGFLKPVLPIGKRIAGSWIAAMALLVGALALRASAG